MKPHPLTAPIPRSWDKPLEEFRLSLRAGGRSEATIALRIHHLRRFARDMDKGPMAVTPALLLAWCGEQTWAAETRHAYYSSLRSFFGFLWVDCPDKNPATYLPRIKRGAGTPRPAPIKAITHTLSTVPPRDAMAIKLAACLGLRVGEICKIHIQDITQDSNGFSIIVHGKGAKKRIVPVPGSLAIPLMKMAVENGGWAFPGKDNGHLSSGYLSKVISRELPEGWTAHTLRHRFATEAYRAERDLLSVQRLLGHSSVATTQRYAEPPDDALRVAVEAAAYPIRRSID